MSDDHSYGEAWNRNARAYLKRWLGFERDYDCSTRRSLRHGAFGDGYGSVTRGSDRYFRLMV